MSDDFRKQIVDGCIQENIWNKSTNMLKSLAKRSRRVNAKNTPNTNAITPVISVTVTGNVSITGAITPVTPVEKINN